MKIFLVSLLVSSSLFGYAYADFHERLVILLPNEKDLLDVGWKMGEIKAMKGIQTPFSDEHPNVLLRQYGHLTDDASKSSIKVTMNVYEFSSPETANSTNIKYSSQILSNNFKQIPTNTVSNDNCYAFIYHEKMSDEKSTVSCNANNFLIVSTAEQNGGPVSLKNSTLSTNLVAEGFAKFSLVKISVMSKSLLPSWIKNNASWWSQSKISDDDFAKGLEYMINQGIITIPNKIISEQSETKIPSWVKNNAEWWSQNKLSDDEFLRSIQYLVNSGIIKINAKA